MARLNRKPDPLRTHEGGTAKRINHEAQLRRSVMACMLWEREFYEDGKTIADRIVELVPLVDPVACMNIAIDARTKSKLRHVPLLIAAAMAKYPDHKGVVSETLFQVIKRADELTEFLAIYWKINGGKAPLSGQVKKGLARAFGKFDEHALAKYNRPGDIKLRDVLFLCHPKPVDEAQDALWKRLIAGDLAVPDTWEVALSAEDGVSPHEKWQRLLKERKLGALACLRNIRNMKQAGITDRALSDYIITMGVDWVLPFRFIAAARFAPSLEEALEQAMFRSLQMRPKLDGPTLWLIDVSGSMKWRLSDKSDMDRLDAACGVAMCGRELCEGGAIFTFSNQLVEVPNRRGFALRDAVLKSQRHGGTLLGQAVRTMNPHAVNFKRLVVVTDEQSHDRLPDPAFEHAYMINVASNRNGVGYGPWTHIDGWSESVIDYITQYEQQD